MRPAAPLASETVGTESELVPELEPEPEPEMLPEPVEPEPE